MAFRGIAAGQLCNEGGVSKVLKFCGVIMRRNKSINTVLGKSFFHRDFITSSTYVKCYKIV